MKILSPHQTVCSVAMSAALLWATGFIPFGQGLPVFVRWTPVFIFGTICAVVAINNKRKNDSSNRSDIDKDPGL